jgi:hypothetical protein
MTTDMEQTTQQLNFDLNLETTQLADYVQSLKFEETDEYFEFNKEISILNYEFESLDNESD